MPPVSIARPVTVHTLIHIHIHTLPINVSSLYISISRCTGVCRCTVASKVGNGQSASQLQLMVMRWYPGEDPLEDAALSPLEQLLHGLVYGEQWRHVTSAVVRQQYSCVSTALTRL